jgi:drug/metabolite transporter (DMT)-like permease
MSTIELRASPAIGERPLDHGDHTPETTSAAARGAQRGLLLSVLLNAVVPVVVYNLALRSVTSSEAVALSLAAVVPLLGTAVELARRRRLDFIGTLAVLGIAVSLGGTLVSGDPRLLLVRSPAAPAGGDERWSRQMKVQRIRTIVFSALAGMASRDREDGR